MLNIGDIFYVNDKINVVVNIIEHKRLIRLISLVNEEVYHDYWIYTDYCNLLNPNVNLDVDNRNLFSTYSKSILVHIDLYNKVPTTFEIYDQFSEAFNKTIEFFFENTEFCTYKIKE